MGRKPRLCDWRNCRHDRYGRWSLLNRSGGVQRHTRRPLPWTAGNRSGQSWPDAPAETWLVRSPGHHECDSACSGQRCHELMGRYQISALGSATDKSLALYHGQVHQFLVPKLYFLRNIRVKCGLAATPDRRYTDIWRRRRQRVSFRSAQKAGGSFFRHVSDEVRLRLLGEGRLQPRTG
jgi:hypothetical protein